MRKRFVGIWRDRDGLGLGPSIASVLNPPSPASSTTVKSSNWIPVARDFKRRDPEQRTAPSQVQTVPVTDIQGGTDDLLVPFWSMDLNENPRDK